MLLFTGAIKKHIATLDIPGRVMCYDACWCGIFRLCNETVCPTFYILFLSKCLSGVAQILLYFQLVSSASHFLATVADRAQYTYLFEGQDVLTSICKDVIIPNMVFRGKRCDWSHMVWFSMLPNFTLELWKFKSFVLGIVSFNVLCYVPISTALRTKRSYLLGSTRAASYLGSTRFNPWTGKCLSAILMDVYGSPQSVRTDAADQC
jgi:hypothetical protein